MNNYFYEKPTNCRHLLRLLGQEGRRFRRRCCGVRCSRVRGIRSSIVGRLQGCCWVASIAIGNSGLGLTVSSVSASIVPVVAPVAEVSASTAAHPVVVAIVARRSTIPGVHASVARSAAHVAIVVVMVASTVAV